MWQSLQKLIDEKKEIIAKNHLIIDFDVAKVKAEKACQHFKNKQNLLAIKIATKALKLSPNLFLAQKIIIKSYLSLGLKIIANNYLQSFFDKNPTYNLIKLHYFLHKKNLYQKQLKIAKILRIGRTQLDCLSRSIRSIDFIQVPDIFCKSALRFFSKISVVLILISGCL